MKRNRRTERSREGFTLVELLIVLAILVMLMAFAVPRLIGVIGGAREDTAKAQIGSFMSALDLYQSAAGEFPTTEQGLWALLEQPDDYPETARWNKLLKSRDELIDPWGSEYQYELDEGADEPRIWSYGPDRKDDTEDDILSWNPDEESGMVGGTGVGGTGVGGTGSSSGRAGNSGVGGAIGN